MSNITTDFITATKKIHADVRSILANLHLIQKDVQLIREEQNSLGDKRKSEEPSDSAVVPSRKNRSTQSQQDEALDEKRFRLEERAFRIGKRTLIIVAAYTALTAFQSWLAKRSADATIKAADAGKISADAARDTLLRSQRPWIGLDHQPTILFQPKTEPSSKFWVAWLTAINLSRKRSTIPLFASRLWVPSLGRTLSLKRRLALPDCPIATLRIALTNNCRRGQPTHCPRTFICHHENGLPHSSRGSTSGYHGR